MKICNFGSLNIDYVYSVERFVRAGETVPTLGRSIICGGKGLNQSIALAHTGARVYHAGNVGAMDGQVLLSTLQVNGVDVSLINKQNMANGHAIIQVDQRGENCILLFGGTNHLVTKEQIEETLAHFSPGDIIVLQNEINMLPEIIRHARARGMKIILNPSPVAGILETTPLECVDYLFVNEKEACLLGGGDSPQDSAFALRKKYPQMTIVCTLGKRGSVVYGAQEIYCPAYPVKAVDTTGAGDTFLGFYVGCMACGKDTNACLKYGSAAAALSVQRKGASLSIPSQNDVERFLQDVSCEER